jgi:hypothetical protein
MRHWRRIGIGALLFGLTWSGAAYAGDSSEPAERRIPDLRLSVIDQPGEVSLRLPLGAERNPLYGILNPYLSLGSSVPLTPPTLAPGPSRDSDPVENVRLGAGMAVPVSERVNFYGEYRFVRGRLDPGVGRDLLQSDPGAVDIRAGFSIRFD